MPAGRSAVQQLEMLQSQMQQADRHLGQLEASILEIQQAIATLEALQDGQAEGPVLVPIGGGVHVRAAIEKDSTVLFELGAETAIDGSIPAALGTLGTRRDRIRQVFEQTASQLQQMGQMAQQLQQGLSSSGE